MDEASTDATAFGAGWVIEPRRAGLVARLRDVWRYRRLLLFFAKRSFQKLYANTILGKSWIFIRPLLPLVIQTLVFGGVLGLGSSGIPYFLFVSVGMAPWELFAQATQWGTRSLQINSGLLTRIYIPRMILPIATMAPAVLNFAIHLAVVAGAIVYFRVTTGVLYFTPLNLAWTVLAILMALLLALGISLWTSVPALVARDVRFTLQYILGFWLFLTPVLYPLPRTAKYGWLVAANPMSAVVMSFKHGMLGLDRPSFGDFAISFSVLIAVLGSGLWFFGRAEANAVDKI